MNYLLLEHFKKCTQARWLENHNNQELYELTKQRLTQLSALISNSQARVKVFIVEINELNFISALLASIITDVDIFLCNPYWQQKEWGQVLAIAQPDLIWGDKATQQLIDRTKPSNRILTVKHPILSNQSLIMIPTGGTSGKVKFAIHTWSSLTASVTGFCNYFQIEMVNSFCILPLYHVSGLMQLVRSFITKGKLFIAPYRIIKEQKIKINISTVDYFISLVPTQLQFLIESNPLWLANFYTVLLGGAPTARSLLEQARKYQIPLAPTYGMTETASQIVTLKPEDFLGGNNSSGQVLPHARVNIFNDADDLIQDNQPGIINIKADSLCLGYYPQIFPQPQFFTTDDLGWFDSQGYLHIIGRNSHKIITGGENVFPTEVEEVILATKLVRDVCVIGLPDPKWGQVVTAVYVPIQTNFDLVSIEQKIQQQLSKYKHPKYWIPLKNLPRSDRGKLNYQQITQMALKYLESIIDISGDV